MTLDRLMLLDRQIADAEDAVARLKSQRWEATRIPKHEGNEDRVLLFWPASVAFENGELSENYGTKCVPLRAGIHSGTGKPAWVGDGWALHAGATASETYDRWEWQDDE